MVVSEQWYVMGGANILLCDTAMEFLEKALSSPTQYIYEEKRFHEVQWLLHTWQELLAAELEARRVSHVSRYLKEIECSDFSDANETQRFLVVKWYLRGLLKVVHFRDTIAKEYYAPELDNPNISLANYDLDNEESSFFHRTLLEAIPIIQESIREGRHEEAKRHLRRLITWLESFVRDVADYDRMMM